MLHLRARDVRCAQPKTINTSAPKRLRLVASRTVRETSTVGPPGNWVSEFIILGRARGRSAAQLLRERETCAPILAQCGKGWSSRRCFRRVHRSDRGHPRPPGRSGAIVSRGGGVTMGVTAQRIGWGSRRGGRLAAECGLARLSRISLPSTTCRRGHFLALQTLFWAADVLGTRYSADPQTPGELMLTASSHTGDY